MFHLVNGKFYVHENIQFTAYAAVLKFKRINIGIILQYNRECQRIL